MVSRKLALIGCIVMMMTMIATLVLSIQNDIGWLFNISIIGIIIYGVGLSILLYDYIELKNE